MPKKSKTLCVDDLRHAEYYGMQDTFDELYQKSQNGEVFENLMDLILSRDNILLAYRNIKANKGSYTAGTDKMYWSSFLVTLCSEIMLYIETPLVSYSYSLNEVSHSCTS